MKIQLSDYRHSMREIEALLKTHHEPDFQKIGPTAVATHTPIIAVAHYYGELFGFSPALDKFIGRLMEFYKVDQVEG